MGESDELKSIHDMGLVEDKEKKVLDFLNKIYSIDFENHSAWEKEIFNFFSKETLVFYLIESTTNTNPNWKQDLISVFISPFQKSTMHIDTNRVYQKLIKIKESIDAGSKLRDYLDFFFIHNVFFRQMACKKDDYDDSRFKKYGTQIERIDFEIKFKDKKNEEKIVYQYVYFVCPDKDIDYPFEYWAQQIRKKFKQKLLSKIKNKKNNNSRKPIDSRLRHECFKRDNYKCVECGATNREKTLHADHILPVSQGGQDELSNLQTLCSDCNIAKSNKNWVGGENE